MSFFMVFPLVAVTWNTNRAILGVQSLFFYMPVASILHPGDHFVSLGTFDGTMEGHWGAQNQMTESTPRVIGVAGRKRQLVK